MQRKPLVLNASGHIEEIPSGDTLEGISSTTQPILARYWMLWGLQTYNFGASAPALSGLEFRPSIGGSRLNGTVTVSSEHSASEGIDNAFNNDSLTSLWSATVNGDHRPWIQVDFTTPQQIHEIMLRSRNDGWFFTTPTTLHLMYSNNGISWNSAGIILDTSAEPTAGEVRLYDVSSITGIT